jgi:hypothetical protein
MRCIVCGHQDTDNYFVKRSSGMKCPDWVGKKSHKDYFVYLDGRYQVLYSNSNKVLYNNEWYQLYGYRTNPFMYIEIMAVRYHDKSVVVKPEYRGRIHYKKRDFCNSLYVEVEPNLYTEIQYNTFYKYT